MWDADNGLCLLPGPLPGSHQPIRFISINQEWHSGTMTDRESKLQLPRSKHLVCPTLRIVLAEPQPHCSCVKPITMNHWGQIPVSSLNLKELPAEGYRTEHGERTYWDYTEFIKARFKEERKVGKGKYLCDLGRNQYGKQRV